MFFVFSDELLLVLSKNVREINIKKDGLHPINAVYPVFPGGRGYIIPDDAEPSFFTYPINDLLVFHDDHVVPETANGLKQGLAYEQALIPKTDGIYVEAGEPGIGAQEPVVVIEFQTEASRVIAGGDLSGYLRHKIERRKRVCMQEIQQAAPGDSRTAVHLYGPARPFVEHYPNAGSTCYLHGFIRTLPVAQNDFNDRPPSRNSRKVFQQSRQMKRFIPGRDDNADGKSARQINKIRRLVGSTLLVHTPGQSKLTNPRETTTILVPVPYPCAVLIVDTILSVGSATLIVCNTFFVLLSTRMITPVDFCSSTAL